MEHRPGTPIRGELSTTVDGCEIHFAPPFRNPGNKPWCPLVSKRCKISQPPTVAITYTLSIKVRPSAFRGDPRRSVSRGSGGGAMPCFGVRPGW